MAYELTEPLLIPFHEHGPDQGGGHARGGEDSPSFCGPALRATSSRGHTQLRIARTNETKRFPGWTHPPTSDARGSLQAQTKFSRWLWLAL